MKQKLQKQKGRLMSSLLPQKWLMSLFTLLLFCIGGGSAWADTEIWKVDFNQLATDAAVTDKSNLSNPSNENYKQMGLNISISHLNYDGVSENIYLQNIGDFRWLKQGGIFYLNQVGSGQRHLIIKNCKAGQKFTITHNGVDMNSDTPIYDAVGNLKNKTISGNTLTYEVVASGDIDLQIGKRALLKEMALYAPATCSNVNHSVWTEGTVGTGSDAYNTAFSQFYELESGKQYHFTFHIAGGDKSYKNWYLQAAKTKAHSGDTGWAELLWVRQDRFGFFDGTNVHLFRNNSQTELNAQNADATLHDDATFINDMKNADVDMTVTYADKKLFVYAKTTSSTGNKYYLTGVKSADNGSDPVQLFFGVEAAKITSLTAKEEKVYQEKAVYDGGNTGNGTFEINSVDDIIYPYYMNGTEKITYISKGESIKIFSTPDASSSFNGNGNYMDNPRTWTQNDEDNHTFYVKFMFNGIKYVLNGGEGKTEDPLGNVTLPRPTKAGHTFIGWMNAANEILPTAGYAGETKTFDASTTLYALWYKNNCEIDFTSTGPLKDAPNKAYAYISENGLFIAGGTSMGNITIDNKAIDSRFGVQTGTNWMYYNGGLYQNNSGNRSYGVNGCIAGEYIVINSNTNPNVNAADAELVSQDGNIYTYKVLKDGGVKFTPSRFTLLYTITVSSPCNHTIWADGNVADADHLAGWWNNFSDYYKISKGQTLNFRFTIHGGEKSRDHWTFYAQSIAKHNGDLGVATTENERVILGADGLRGGTKGWKAISFTRNGTELPRADWNHSLEDWANESKPSDTQFSIDMKHAVVDMTVEYGEDGTMNIVATSVVGTNTYVLRLTSDPIAEETLYLFFTAQNSWMEGIEHPIKFDKPNDNVVITGNGTAVYEQLAKGNPEGTWVKYSVGATTGSAKATVSQINGSNEYQLTVSGRGTVEIIAQCGTQTTTCILTVDGMFFNDPTPVIAHHKTEYTATLNIEDAAGVSYALVEYDTNINGVSLTPSSDNKSVNVNIPTGTEGGVVVVRATKGTAIAEFCLTVAYDKNIWDLYSDPLHYGTVAEGDKTGSRPGSAHYVIFHGDGSYQYEGVTVSKETDPVTGEEVEVETYGDKTDGNRVLFNQYMDRKDYYEKENWFNRQTGTITQGSITKDYDLLRRNWKYTYKTCTYVDGKRTYVNEPLFAFIRPVIGDNARIVKETQGLVFNAAPNAWGVSDNDITNAEGADQSVREADRCILMHTGTSMTVPYVKAGRYVRLHWYRHSTNAGDMFTAENAMDLDGKVINPNDWIRFTGSHYYGHTDEAESTGLYGHKGSAIFYIPTQDELNGKNTYDMFNFVKDGDGDDCVNFKVTIKNGWTEVYRVEIMDKYMTELKLCQVDCYPEIGTQGGTPYTHRATIENYNAQDINTPSIYNATDHNKIAAKLASRVKTLQATGGHPKEPAHILDAPSLYINGYAGNCYTWNGWQNMALVAENVDGSTSLGFETAREEVAVGNRITYPMYKLYNVHGSGAIKLTLKCISGAINVPEEARYCLNKQEAYVAAGEYSVQEYPYTWDFTKYNMDRGSLAYPEHIGSPMLSNITNSGFNRANAYGRWENKTGNGEIAGLHAAEQQTIKWSAKQSNLNADNYKNTDQPVIGGTSGTIKHIIREQDIRNKRYFAQTSQLTISDGDYRVISETEGLRMSMSAIDDGSNLNKIYFKGEAANGEKPADGNDNGYKGVWKNTSLYVDGTITIPEVYEGMYVYIRSPKKPKSVTGAVDYNRSNPGENREVNSVPVKFYDDKTDVKHMSNDIPDGVWVYKVEAGQKKIDLVTGELKADGDPVSDVVVTLSDEDKTVEAIGVTWFFKPMTLMASNTNDYSTFSTDSRGERIDYNNTKLFTKHHLAAQISTGNVVINDKVYGENGAVGMKPIAVVPAAEDVNDFAGKKRGLLLEDVVDRSSSSTATKRPLLPLFVPACNLADESLDGNCLIAADGDPVGASTSSSTKLNYVFTTQSYSYNWGENTPLSDVVIKNAAFYLLGTSGELRKNSAYLQIDRPAKNGDGTYGVKQIILVKGEVEEGDATSIETIDTDAEIADLDGADVYTVTGIKVAKPTKKGVYVVNGKKVYVK